MKLVTDNVQKVAVKAGWIVALTAIRQKYLNLRACTCTDDMMRAAVIFKFIQQNGVGNSVKSFRKINQKATYKATVG